MKPSTKAKETAALLNELKIGDRVRLKRSWVGRAREYGREFGRAYYISHDMVAACAKTTGLCISNIDKVTQFNSVWAPNGDIKVDFGVFLDWFPVEALERIDAEE